MFAVISSYVLSRTLVPTMIMFFERHHHKQTGEKHVAFWVRPLVALQQGFEKAFDRFREAYANLLGTVLGQQSGLRCWISLVLRCHLAARSLSRAKFLSRGGRRHVSIARAGADRDADRANGQAG